MIKQLTIQRHQKATDHVVTSNLYTIYVRTEAHDSAISKAHRRSNLDNLLVAK